MFKKIVLFIIIYLLLLQSQTVSAQTLVYTISRDIRLQYIVYDKADPNYKIYVSVSQDATTLAELMNQKNAISGINGVFFCPEDYSECAGKNFTINERFVEGSDKSFYNDTGERGVFGWDTTGEVFIYKTNSLNSGKRKEIYEGLGNFPIIFFEGKNMLEHYHDVGLYDKKMSAKLPRHFICSTQDGQKIFFGRSSSTSLDNLAPSLYDIGCYNALNLDAGASSQFQTHGETLIKGKRKVLDAFVIEYRNIDVQALQRQAEYAKNHIEKRFSAYSDDQKRKRVKHMYIHVLTKARNDIIKKHMQVLRDENQNVIETSLYIDNVKDIQRLYILNILLREMR